MLQNDVAASVVRASNLIPNSIFTLCCLFTLPIVYHLLINTSAKIKFLSSILWLVATVESETKLGNSQEND